MGRRHDRWTRSILDIVSALHTDMDRSGGTIATRWRDGAIATSRIDSAFGFSIIVSLVDRMRLLFRCFRLVWLSRWVVFLFW